MVELRADRHQDKTGTEKSRGHSHTDVLRRIDELYAVADELDGTDLSGAVCEARLLLDQARRELSGRPPRELLRPSQVEALCGVDAAEWELVRAAPEGRIEAALPEIAHRVQAELPPSDSQRLDLEALLASGPEGRPPLRATVLAALTAANLQRRRALTRMSLRTRRIVAGAVALWAAALALAIAGGVRPGGLLEVCYQTTAGTTCPIGGSLSRWDLALVEIAGAVGALLFALPSARSLRVVRLPASAGLLSVAVRVPFGALHAAVVLLLIARGRVPGLSALDSQLQIAVWGVALGTLPHMVVTLLDHRIVDLAHRTVRWYQPVLRPAAEGRRATSPGDRPSPPHRYRLITLVVTAASALIAFAPLAVLLDGWTVPGIAVGVAVGYATQGVSQSPRHRILRRPLPIIRAAVPRALRPMWMASTATLAVHVSANAFLGVGDGLVGGRLPAHAVAAWLTGPLAALLALGAMTRVRADLSRQLSGATGGAQAHKRPPRRVSPYAAAAFAVPGATLLVLAALTGRLSAIDTGATVLMAVLGVVLMRGYLAQVTPAQPREEEFRAKVGSLLAAMGCEVTQRPQLGAPDVDCLLDRLDLMAHRDHVALAVQIHTSRPEDGSTDWRAASELLLATKALERHLRRQRPIQVQPVMLLVDSAPDDSLVRLADIRSVELVSTSPEAQGLRVQLYEVLAKLRSVTPAAQG